MFVCRNIIVLSFIAVSLSSNLGAPANASPREVGFADEPSDLQKQAGLSLPLDWRVGDKAVYRLTISHGRYEGTMVRAVEDDDGTLLWVSEVYSSSNGTTHKLLGIDKGTGRVAHMEVDGRERAPDDAINLRSLSIQRHAIEEVAVPAGRFDAEFFSARAADGAWVSVWRATNVAPMDGLLSQVYGHGLRTLDLISFTRADE